MDTGSDDMGHRSRLAGTGNVLRIKARAELLAASRRLLGRTFAMEQLRG